MAHEWDRGVLRHSSWHGLETVREMADADAMISHGETSGAWPTSVTSEVTLTASGLPVPASAIVAGYAQHPRRVVGLVGDRYRATACDEWRDLVRAAVAAGARPSGAFSLRGGSRVVATFEVARNGLSTHLLLVDTFDGSMRLTCGHTTVDVVCANTLSVALRQDGEGMTMLRHTSSLEQKVRMLEASLGDALRSGEKVRDLVARASAKVLDRDAARAAFDALFPPAAADASPAAVTRAEKAREEARRAAALPINRRGQPAGTLSTLWNAATYLVDRRVDGTARPVRGGGDALDTMLFGARAKRVEEIQTLVEVVLRDGSTQAVPAYTAIQMGADARQVGRAVLSDMLSSQLS